MIENKETGQQNSVVIKELAGFKVKTAMTSIAQDTNFMKFDAIIKKNVS